jgi:two-component system, NarL family, response regulator NreC
LERSTVRILVVEDFKAYRMFVCSLLAENPVWQVVAEVSDGQEAVRKAQQLRPDVVLMDISLPTLNGLEACRRIHELVPSSKIVFLTKETDIDVVEEAHRLGAWGYIAKDRAGTELLPALASVLEGKRFVTGGVPWSHRTED